MARCSINGDDRVALVVEASEWFDWILRSVVRRTIPALTEELAVLLQATPSNEPICWSRSTGVFLSRFVSG